MEWYFVVLAVLAGIAFAAVGTYAAAGNYMWLDVRSAEDADDVRRNIEEYGPLVSGLKLHLLPPDERAAVLEARAQAEAEKSAQREPKRQSQ